MAAAIIFIWKTAWLRRFKIKHDGHRIADLKHMVRELLASDNSLDSQLPIYHIMLRRNSTHMLNNNGL